MADIRERTDVDASGPEHDDGAPPERPADTRRRRPFLIALGIVVAVVVYALAFEHTQVDLTQITSETRQASLQRILRALAQPDLVTYDTREEITEVEIAIPCGPEVTPHPSLAIEPSCGEPGDTVTVTGTGFDPREFVELRFVPDTEFDITLRLASVTPTPTAGSGRHRPAGPHVRRGASLAGGHQRADRNLAEPGEVFTDANENGVEDDPNLGEKASTRSRWRERRTSRRWR